MVFDAFETAIGGCRLRLCRRRRRRAVRMVTVGLVGLGAATVGVVGVDAAFAEVSERRVTSFGNSGHYGYGAVTAVSDATRVVTYAQGRSR
jgi:phage-related minor tail protein